MNHTLFSLEYHVQTTIERIAEDRLSVEPVSAGTPHLLAAARQRIGTALIQIGERVGGPEVRTVRPVSPRPSETLRLGF